MRQFLYCEAGYVEKNQWLPNSWVNVECPTPEDLQFLMDRFNVPESFLSDIADTDERPLSLIHILASFGAESFNLSINQRSSWQET